MQRAEARLPALHLDVNVNIFDLTSPASIKPIIQDVDNRQLVTSAPKSNVARSAYKSDEEACRKDYPEEMASRTATAKKSLGSATETR